MMNKAQTIAFAAGRSRVSADGVAHAPVGFTPTDFLDALRDAAVDTLDLLVTWYVRAQQRRQLVGLESRMLDDIGVSRAEALAEFDKPVWRS
jgi:uncharacterized protein YjiS (DUF1127 family)